MKDFWKNEWGLFLNDMQTLGEFFLQPVTFSSKTLKLNAAEQGLVEQSESQELNTTSSVKQGFANAKEFLTQPVTFKF